MLGMRFFPRAEMMMGRWKNSENLQILEESDNECYSR